MKCQVIGLVSMDSFTVLWPESLNTTDHVCIISDDFDNDTSLLAWAQQFKIAPNVLVTSLSIRLPRVYIYAGKVAAIVTDLTYTY